MNISGIPQLQAAGGFSIGEEVVPAKGHQSGTPPPTGRSRWLLIGRSGGKVAQCPQWEEHIEASIQDIGRQGYCLAWHK